MEIESKETTPTTTDMEKRKSVSFVDEKVCLCVVIDFS